MENRLKEVLRKGKKANLQQKLTFKKARIVLITILILHKTIMHSYIDFC